MAGLSEEDIRKRAYLLWERAGPPAGRMDTYSYEAEKELLAEREKQADLPSYTPNLAAN
ncbi:DUF2934 domain-containing protein (plasmid) [Bradyrhizobium barranii]|uniref:DUF2934 domain-containing protein n=1 Tax=Bradyrhizobium TaxID=374 RepID=UPI003F2897B9